MKVKHECDTDGPWMLTDCWTKSKFVSVRNSGGELYYHIQPNGKVEETLDGLRKVWVIRDIQEEHSPKLGTSTCSICGAWAVNAALREAWGFANDIEK